MGFIPGIAWGYILGIKVIKWGEYLRIMWGTYLVIG